MAWRDTLRTFWRAFTLQDRNTITPTSLHRFPSNLMASPSPESRFNVGAPLNLAARSGFTTINGEMPSSVLGSKSLSARDFGLNEQIGFVATDTPNGQELIRRGKITLDTGPQATMNTNVSAVSKGKASSTVTPLAPPALASGRQSVPLNYNPIGLSGYKFIYRREYQDLDVSNIPIGEYDAIELLVLLADLSPDVSRAIWNVLRLAGTGVKFQVVTPAGEDDLAGQKIVDGIVKRLNNKAGGIRNIIIQLLMSAYLQGGIAIDIAPTPKLDDVEDFYPVNPVTIFFMRDDNQVPIPFQRQPLFWGSLIAPFRRMNTDLFYYTPIDPAVDDVYGRPPTASALQMVFFQTQVYRDLQRVIHQQGWPKIDISVLTEILANNMPPDVKDDDQRYQDWIGTRLSEVISAYNSMDPEDAYVHPDYIKVSSDNAKAGNGLFNVTGLLEAIRSQVISALKMLPVVMGESAGATETFATVELAIFGQSVETLRDPVGEILAKCLEIALQLQGHAAEVKSSWKPIQVLSRMQVALAVAQEASNQVFFRDQGWISQDQASKAVTGSAAVSQEIPLYTMIPPAPVPQEPTPNNGPIPAHIKNAQAKS